MNKLSTAILLFLLASASYGQSRGEPKGNKGERDFKYPVLVKLIQGQGNVFRIGFVRYNDFHEVRENTGEDKNIYASFINLVDIDKGDFKNKCFVYFPLSERNGEMIIVEKSDITKLDMRYEQAMELIVVN